MKICAISDQHGWLPEIPSCDLLLIAGDLTPASKSGHFWNWHRSTPTPGYYEHPSVHDMRYQAHWLNTEFRQWLDAVPAKHVVAIAGNHDRVFQFRSSLVPQDLRWTYLQDSGCTVDGLSIWGSPWQIPFGQEGFWAFNGHDSVRQAAWSKIPDDVDVLLVHGPALSYGDLAPRTSPTPGFVHTGCPLLLDRLPQLKRLKLFVFGHIHEGRGAWTMGKTILANVTLRDGAYGYAYLPMVWELHAERGLTGIKAAA